MIAPAALGFVTYGDLSGRNRSGQFPAIFFQPYANRAVDCRYPRRHTRPGGIGMERAAASQPAEEVGALDEPRFHWGRHTTSPWSTACGPHGATTAAAASSPIPSRKGSGCGSGLTTPRCRCRGTCRERRRRAAWGFDVDEHRALHPAAVLCQGRWQRHAGSPVRTTRRALPSGTPP